MVVYGGTNILLLITTFLPLTHSFRAFNITAAKYECHVQKSPLFSVPPAVEVPAGKHELLSLSPYNYKRIPSPQPIAAT